MRTAATILSYVFHPLWMPLMIFGLALWLDPFLVAQRSAIPFLVTVLLVNVFAPAASIWLMKKRGVITAADMPERKERTGPYMIVIAYYFISYWFLRESSFVLSPQLVAMFVAVWSSLLLAMLINFKWKISVHMLSQGGMIGCLAALSSVHFLGAGSFLVLLVLISGWVGFARIYLNAHTHAQVYAGFILGFVVNYVVVMQSNLF